MGVHGLWDLLAPVGRRVSVETLAGKKLAIDASIWMIQFMKAMRDEKGEMVRNAHILGFFRRICKLLYLRTKPVFVFDGGTPALKRRTVVARRRQRENAQAKIRKTAEKLLLNQLKAMRLRELAADLEKQRADSDTKGKRPIVQESVNVNEQQHAEKTSDKAGVGYTQEELDEMVAASIAAEEDERFAVDASTSGMRVSENESFGDGDEDDDEEEIVFPEMQGKVDPAVLASLPPSMQLDLLVQMRERLMAENRQKYQKVKKAPERFSELQIQSYLKTVAFRREIDAVQKSAAGRGIGGVQTSRIASEANREFIFSSSFTGDKRVLSSVGQGGVEADQNQPSTSNLPSDTINKVESSKRGTAVAELNVGEPTEAFHDGVETYTDERGRIRVSRLRALGIRMTRDLQRNLDLMKEIDREKELNNKKNNTVDTRNAVVDIPNISLERNHHENIGDEEIFEVNDDVADTSEAHVSNNAIEISFEEVHAQENEDDNFFARLVVGDNSASAKQSSSSASDCEWEEGAIEGVSTPNIPKGPANDEEDIEWEDGSQDIQLKPLSRPDETESRSHISKDALQEESDIQEAIRRSLEQEDEEDIEWEDGSQDIQLKPMSRPDETESRSQISKGVLQEESDIQEAIRRSLEEHSTYVNEPRGDHRIAEKLGHAATEDDDVLRAAEKRKKPQNKDETVDVNQPFIGSIAGNSDVDGNSAPVIELTPNDRSNSKSNLIHQQGCSSGVLSGKGLVDSNSVPSQMGSSMAGDHEHAVNIGESGNEDIMKDIGSSDREDVSLDSNSLNDKPAFTELFGGRSIDHKSADQNLVDDDFNKTSDVLKASQASNPEVKTHGEFCVEEGETANGSPLVNIGQHDITEEDLNEEMMLLDKERDVLTNKQKKLERNAESVSSEMFAECQELLQMFGLPYIIAPMEAEAQCAFMELSNLIDGVVTDDSDALLFGARNVYKNIFDDRKYVETYFMKDIEDELGLDREKLIHMALLLGSDYTEGISGIGIVNAIEVVNAFPGKDGLREFREWIESPDPAILGKADVSAGKSSRKKWSKLSDADDTHGEDDGDRIRQIFMDKHRNVSKNWHVPSSFPSDMVISAYDSPQVDKSTEPFSWGKPDLFVLRKLCWEKFGWNNTKADELLLPVLKEYNKHETQLRLEAFYTFNERFAKIRSKRIKKAVKGISGKKRKSNHGEADETDELVGVGSVDAEFTGPSDSSAIQRQVKPRLARKNPQRNADDKVIATRESNVRGRRGRGRGRGQPSGTRKRKKNTPNTETESSHDDDSDTDKELQFDLPEGSTLVRRSGRTRKTVNYTVSGASDDEKVKHENQLDREEIIDTAFVSETVTEERLNEDSRKEYSADETEKADRVEGESVEISEDRTNDRVDLNESSKSYLFLGGGFCDDGDGDDGGRNELETDERTSSPSNSEIFAETTQGKSLVEENQEDVRSLTAKDKAPSDDYLPTDDMSTDETGNRFRGSLRAMPGLRRKKPRT